MNKLLTFVLLLIYSVTGYTQTTDSIKSNVVRFSYPKTLLLPKKKVNQTIDLISGVGLYTHFGNNSITFYSTILDSPSPGFVPMEGLDFFSEIQSIQPEDDSDLRVKFSKKSAKFETGINLFSKQIQIEEDDFDFEDANEIDDLSEDIDDLDDVIDDQDEEDDNPSNYKRQGIKFNSTYHLLQSDNNSCDINLQMIVFQNNSGSNNDVDGFDEDDLPSKTIIGGFGYQMKNIRIDFDSKFVSSIIATSEQTNRQSIKVFNASLTYFQNSHATITLACNNILNENRLSKNGFGVLKNPKLFLNQSRYFIITYLYQF